MRTKKVIGQKILAVKQSRVKVGGGTELPPTNAGWLLAPDLLNTSMQIAHNPKSRPKGRGFHPQILMNRPQE